MLEIGKHMSETCVREYMLENVCERVCAKDCIRENCTYVEYERIYMKMKKMKQVNEHDIYLTINM